MNKHDLLDERYTLAATCRKIIKGAEGRELTTSEKADFDKNMKRSDELGAELEKMETEIYKMSLGESRAKGTELLNGQEVRSYNPGEPLKFDANPDFDIGRVIKAGISGNRDNLSREERDASVAILTGGGYTVPSNTSQEILQYARENFALGQIARFIEAPKGGNLRVAKVSGEPTAYWTGENQTLTASALTFGAVDMRLKKVATYIKASRELAADGYGFVEQVRSSLSYSVMRALELAAFEGTSAGDQPAGIDADPNVLTSSGASGAITLDNYMDFAVYALAAQNASLDDLHMVAHSKWYNFVDTLTTASFYALSNANGGTPTALSRVKRHVSNVLTNATGDILTVYTIAGGALAVLIDPAGTQILITEHASDAFTKDQVWIRVILRADIGILKPEWIHAYKLVDAT